MARDIEARRTRYNGETFRSKLEAQWAVFWDELGVKWEYEPQMFELPDGKQYIPDFWIVDLALWVEIKPNAKIAREEDAKWKCEQLAYKTGDRVYLDQGGFAWPISEDWAYSNAFVAGGAEVYSVLFYYITGHVEGDFIYHSENHYWATCPECGKLGIAKDLREGYSINYIFSCECYTRTRHLSLHSNSEIVMKAYDKALKYWS
ncbi:hypothetical protein QUA43_24270 [Microcoleus sp. N9_B4]|uniref:hypothetical protein n=1 Tax=Microcoleus sp. N9_B4 TaxID=3055386 RepID=UPI002FCEF9E9